ncbi:MAG: hypothetical protein A3D31_06325 [Candidatus Fluviicola riflensis]|nr:MAG: hypothetical protein CHH17_08690 [Candidatus Fluviicola riflensis]OGS79579.1 MAG: hypothetical protein A3D31_06325 [Candidatus Fluviicola riflensis]OGS87010.1 MAG: hypothetical protein A2724_05785 [Fluviicola sp. RIFCSPHIGHO2_01_FULL_43_53]OGS89801.1 MAG: hypothetical protein A3E30_02530 [Fluviicola sp. RIFCSPHIGHO2_12_FULL_43_24]
MSDVLDQSYEQGQAKRPMFLQVLCILTFVSCGLTFISSIYGLLTAEQNERTLKMMMRMQQNSEVPELVSGMQDGLSKIMEWTTTSHYLALGNVFICLAGALLMWRLKKPGYFIYIFGQVLPFISLVGMYSAVQDIPILGFTMVIGGIIAAIFAVAFIIMYGLNVKHMR